MNIVLVAACALVDPDGRVLLARRPPGKPLAGLLAFPGGGLGAGAPLAGAGGRVLREETGLEAADLKPLTVIKIAPSPDESSPGFRLTVFRANWISGEPIAADDAAEAGFFGLEELLSLPTTGSTEALARALLSRE